MLTLLLSNVGLALLQRAIPNLNAMMVAIPLTILVGLLTLLIALPVIGSAIAGWMGGLGADAARALQALGSGAAR
jgi:flagellar biosynthetic protein FliR